MAQQSRKPLPPRRSLPPLTFDDPELDSLIANDNHPTEPPPEPRSSLSGLTFGSVPPPAKARPSVANPPRASVVNAPRTSTTGAPRPSLATAPTQHALRPVAPPAPAAGAGVEAILGALPSIPPEPAVDPSFAPAKDPSFASAPPPPPAPPAPAPPPAVAWHEAASARLHGLVDRAVERLPDWPRALEDVPATVALALALALFFFQLGAGVRWVRGLVRLLAALSG